MATFNGARFIASQIESILSQLRPGDELLVSDDGSTDETLALLEAYGERVQVVASSSSGGIVSNFCRVLSHASRDFVLLADQDDVWLPNRLDAMRAALAGCDLVMTNALVVNERLEGDTLTLFDQLHPSVSFWRNLARNTFVGCCMGFRRSLLLRVMPLPGITPWHDWLIGLFACMTANVRLIDTPMLLYRRHGANASETGARSKNGMLRKLRLRRDILAALAVCAWRRFGAFSRR